MKQRPKHLITAIVQNGSISLPWGAGYRFTNNNKYVLSKYSITSANDWQERDPADWQLLGSNDGANWSTLDTRANETFSSRFLRREFTVSNTDEFSFFKLNITKVKNPSSANSVQLAEIELIGHVYANDPPTVETQASVNPDPVIGTTCNLSVLGADDGGEASLTYTWAATVTPPGPVTFSPNGTNAAKNSTASFNTSGDYSFEVTIQDIPGLTITSNVSVSVTIETPTCPEWVDNITYNAGTTVMYEGQLYIANRFVYQNTPPRPEDNEWFWSPTDFCKTVSDRWQFDDTNAKIFTTDKVGIGFGTEPGWRSPELLSSNFEVFGDAIFHKNLGINTQATSHALDVNGEANFSGNVTFAQGVGIGVPPSEHLLEVIGESLFHNNITVDYDSDTATSLVIEENKISIKDQGNYSEATLEVGEFRIWKSGVPPVWIRPGQIEVGAHCTLSDGILWLGNTQAWSDHIQTPLMNTNELNPLTGTKISLNGRLDVDDEVYCRNITVTLDAFPDHVFSKSYNLRSLEELENYIKKHGHLPDIPTEKEVKEKGVNLGEMHAKLLEKIEEMTLHMIQMQKRIDELEAKQSTKE